MEVQCESDCMPSLDKICDDVHIAYSIPQANLGDSELPWVEQYWQACERIDQYVPNVCKRNALKWYPWLKKADEIVPMRYSDCFFWRSLLNISLHSLWQFEYDLCMQHLLTFPSSFGIVMKAKRWYFGLFHVPRILPSKCDHIPDTP